MRHIETYSSVGIFCRLNLADINSTNRYTRMHKSGNRSLYKLFDTDQPTNKPGV